jgi:hypothetical protein
MTSLAELEEIPKIKCYVNDDSTVRFNGKVMSITSLREIIDVISVYKIR